MSHYVLNMATPERPYKQGLLIPVSRLKTPVGKQDNYSVQSDGGAVR